LFPRRIAICGLQFLIRINFDPDNRYRFIESRARVNRTFADRPRHGRTHHAAPAIGISQRVDRIALSHRLACRNMRFNNLKGVGQVPGEL